MTAGAGYTIKWTKNGTNIPQVKLEFSTDGINYNPIGTVNNTGEANWTVPVTTNSTTCKLRISDPNNEEATRAVSANFEIRALIDVTAPLSSAKWVIGTSANNVSWTVTGIVQNVKIDYSKDGGSDGYAYNIVPSRAYDQSPYPWTLPTDQDILSANQAKIKVSDASYSVVYDTSANFMIKSGISVSAPATSTIARIGDAFTISWNTLGTANMGNVNIYFSKTGGPAWGTAVATVLYSASPYVGFSLPLDSITNNLKAAKVKIEDADNAEVFDESDAFEIEGKIVLDAPIESGLKWTVNSTQQIKWTPQGTYSPVRVEYSKNGFSDELETVLIQDVSNASHNTQRVFDWTVPDAVGNNIKVRVSHKDDSNVAAVCPSAITVLGGITNIVPNGGQIWYKSDPNKEISWYANGTITNVKIEYRTTPSGSFNNTIVADDAAHTAGSNSYIWTAVADENSETCFIRVSDADVNRYNDVYGVSAASFSIRPKLNVTLPVQDANILVGSNNNTVSWALNGSTKVQYVKLYYSKNNGPFTNVINDSGTVDATLNYTWNGIPDDISDNIKVRVVDSVNTNVYADSPSFDIIGSVTVQQPNSSANWVVGSTDKNITWTYTGSIGTVDIYYD
ncbi:MAG: hypothetical protein HZC16_00230, partial [Candidatus Omnitrophica bacterium]|nr:hypothetical protein [Candidatus Omnitrophota bacterium]